jgi:hypothetical protein
MGERKGTEKPHEFTVICKCHEQGGSRLVAIPKLWADAEVLENGSSVEISFNGTVKTGPAGNRSESRKAKS